MTEGPAESVAAQEDIYADIDPVTCRTVASWVRRFARGYGPTAQRRFEAIARQIEAHNTRMAEKRKASTPPPRFLQGAVAAHPYWQKTAQISEK